MTDTSHAVVAEQVQRLPFLAGGGGASPTPRLHLTTATVAEVNPLLASSHYLGPVSSSRYCFTGWTDDVLVACQVWRWPTARMLPSDGSWLELSRWCLTPDAGKNAGSRMMGWVARWLRKNAPTVVTLVSYSDPVHGHSGSLYKASGWTYTPTHHGERYDANGTGYPSGHGSWDGVTKQAPKHRWTYALRPAASVDVNGTDAVQRDRDGLAVPSPALRVEAFGGHDRADVPASDAVGQDVPLASVVHCEANHEPPRQERQSGLVLGLIPCDDDLHAPDGTEGVGQ